MAVWVATPPPEFRVNRSWLAGAGRSAGSAETRRLTHYADNMPYTRFDYISNDPPILGLAEIQNAIGGCMAFENVATCEFG